MLGVNSYLYKNKDWDRQQYECGDLNCNIIDFLIFNIRLIVL